MATSPTESNNVLPPNLAKLKGWKLEDARVRLGEIVRLARDRAPQRITVEGQDAVVVLSAQEFAQLLPLLEQPSLQQLLSQSPLNRLEFEQSEIEMPVRDIEL